MFPVRCFSCGKVLSGKEYRWEALCNRMSKEDALNALGIKRLCCRRDILTNIDVCSQRLDYEAANMRPPDDVSNNYIKIYHRNDPGKPQIKRWLQAR